MKRQNTDSVQNRFTAYLIAAVVHQRMRYMEKKKLLLQREGILAEQEIKKYLNLDKQCQSFHGEQSGFTMEDEKFLHTMIIFAKRYRQLVR